MNAPAATELPLFPLQTVLFPGGLLALKVFEARYLDLIGSCLRERRPFGVVALKQGREVRGGQERVALEGVGTVAELIDVDSAQHGILQVRCRGTTRFALGATRQQADGLWLATVTDIADDEIAAPAQAMLETVRGLSRAIGSLKAQGVQPFLEPYRFDEVAWVANRWCEILPIPLAAKQKLMELPDAAVRLRLVDEFLRSHKVVQ
jgi:Lon protease-like protein